MDKNLYDFLQKLNVSDECYQLCKDGILKETFQMIDYPNVFFAGQITGVEGYVESIASGMVAGLNMYIQSGQTVAKRMIAFRKEPPKENGGMPCGACREFFLQLSAKNKDMEIMTDFETRKTVTLEELMPGWWGWKRYNQQGAKND